ncbi:MAG: biotin/lipoyl-binding protein, partial [Bacteroidales bacterium]|nr:biotin/lipoyl-binding protein [Bacteroidales bacterium]
KLLIKDYHFHGEPNVWEEIGFWRNQMAVNITYGDEETVVMIDKARGKEYHFRIFDEDYKVTLEFIDVGEIDFTFNDKTYFASITKGDEGKSKVTINNKDFQVARKDLLDGDMVEHGEDEALVGEDNNIIAPIPGRIFKVNIKEGDEIKKGDVVLVIDAMKMENNIVSKRDAVVKKILINMDEMVDAGTALVEIE